MNIELYDYQRKAIDMLRTGSILCGGVGSGKSRTALAYYFLRECKGEIKINGNGNFSYLADPCDLYIITTARKRDSLEWDQECVPFLLSSNREESISNVKVTIDSWNNIHKYSGITGAFFIFDEQRVVGSGSWVNNFLKITKNNNWILLSATPGDTWMDYVPVFIANGFYKNRTEFIRRHVVFKPFSKFYQIDHYVDVERLTKIKKQILVNMDFERRTKSITKIVNVAYDRIKTDTVAKKRWDPYSNKPIKDASNYCSVLRKIVNSDPDRIEKIKDVLLKVDKVIIFYNYDYELDILRSNLKYSNVAEWNGHKHDPIPESDSWVYLVQYTAGAEGWNCIETDTIIFYSLNYSYKIMMQSAGRINRLNTPFRILYYYIFKSDSPIDKAIVKSLKDKKKFNEKDFCKEFA